MNMKEIILYQKKKLIVYTMMTTLGLTSLTGCVSSNFEYCTNGNGEVLVEGTIKFDDLKNLKLIHVTNKIAEFDEYYLVRYFDDAAISSFGSQAKGYVNIENNQIIYIYDDEDYQNFNIEIVVDHLIDYLYKYDMIKETYNIEEVKKIKENLLNDEMINNIEETNKKVLKK